MISRCAIVIAAMATFSLNGAIGQAPFGASLPGKDPDQANTEPHPAKNPNLRQPLAGGNPLWGIPISSLSATRERPLFTSSRRQPAPPEPPQPVAEAPPPPTVAEQPPFGLVGIVIGKPQNVALILDQTTKNLIRLHVGEAASGWYLRSVDLRTMTLEKNNKTATLSLSEPGDRERRLAADEPDVKDPSRALRLLPRALRARRGRSEK
jgi:general secretion pathway protein N